MKAIVLPYVTGQNEPSIPLSKLVDVPASRTGCRQLLEDLYVETFQTDCETAGACSLTMRGPGQDGYGHLSFGDGECFIYLTYVEG